MDADGQMKAELKKEESKDEQSKEKAKRAYGEPKLTKFGPVEELTGLFAS